MILKLRIQIKRIALKTITLLPALIFTVLSAHAANVNPSKTSEDVTTSVGLDNDGVQTVDTDLNSKGAISCMTFFVLGIGETHRDTYSQIPKLELTRSAYEILVGQLASEYRDVILYQGILTPTEREGTQPRVVILPGSNNQMVALNLPRFQLISRHFSVAGIKFELSDFLDRKNNRWYTNKKTMDNLIESISEFLLPRPDQEPTLSSGMTPRWTRKSTLPGNLDPVFGRELSVYKEMMREIAALEATPGTTLFLDFSGNLSPINFHRLNTIRSWYLPSQKSLQNGDASSLSPETKLRITWDHEKEVSRGRPMLLPLIFRYLSQP